MDTLGIAASNLATPMVLAFVVGWLACLAGSDLRFPDAMTKALSMFLLLAIGLKGGVAMRDTSLGEIWLPALAALSLGVTVPVVAYLVLYRVLAFSRVDAGAIAAHYGSVSAVTFAAALTFLDAAGVGVEGYMATLLALLELPGIAVALVIVARDRAGEGGGLRRALREILTGTSMVLLAGGLLMGAVSGPEGYARVEPFFGDLFYGVLTLFLLDLGVSAALRARDLRVTARRLVPFGVVTPVVAGAVGVVVGTAAGLSVGGATVFGAMIASASYIAAPAAVRVALPDANPGLYLTAAIAITFPFNLVLGIPLYHALATAAA